jgi:hypothetical protein
MALKSAGLNLLLILLLLPANAALAEEESTAPKPAKLFSSSETLTVTITAPWKDIQRKENYQGSYPAKIEFTDDLGNRAELAMTAERRGITRQIVCSFPPIKLRFEKEAVKHTTFRGQKSLKMVTHCNRGSIYVQYYLLEMLAYRMYNLITDFSFRVRPLSVTYVDSENGKQSGPVFAFLIEDDSDVAKRNDQKNLKIPKTKRSRLDAEQASNMALFQFMISNLDFASLTGPDPDKCCHNSKLMGHDPDKDPVYPVPYDFDSSGLVNAKYAGPPQGLPVQKVTQRLYRGFCIHNPTMPEAKQRFLDNEQAIYALVNNEPLLTSSTKKKTLRFLGRFFEILKNNKDYQKKIIEKCRK